MKKYRHVTKYSSVVTEASRLKRWAKTAQRFRAISLLYKVVGGVRRFTLLLAAYKQ